MLFSVLFKDCVNDAASFVSSLQAQAQAHPLDLAHAQAPPEA